MKILHVIPYFAPAWSYGGTPRAAFEIAKNQVLFGHDVSVLTTDTFDGKSRLNSFEMNNGIKVYRVKNISNYLAWKFHFVTPINLPSIITREFDVVHLHEVRSLLNMVALYSLHVKKIIISPWGTLPHNNNFILIKKILDVFFISILRKKVDISLAQTKHELLILKKYRIGKKQVILPLGIDSKFFSKLPTKAESRKRLKISQKEFLFVYLGRFSPYKGVDRLILAFHKAIKQGLKAKLLLVGRDDGFMAQIMKRLANDNVKSHVIVTGPLYERDRLFAYKAADWFISLPTIYEETSTTCLEALACGVPVITNKYSQVPFISRNDGVWHIGNEINNQKKSILLASKKKYKIDHKKIINIFDWKPITKKILNLYEKK